MTTIRRSHWVFDHMILWKRRRSTAAPPEDPTEREREQEKTRVSRRTSGTTKSLVVHMPLEGKNALAKKEEGKHEWQEETISRLLLVTPLIYMSCMSRKKGKDVCLEIFVISLGIYQDMQGRCLWFNCVWYILSSSSSSFRDFFFSSSSLSIHCRVNVFLLLFKSISIEISCYAYFDYSSVTSVRVEVSCLKVTDNRWERFFPRRFLFGLECSIVDKRFMSVGIEGYEKQGDPGGVSWPKLDACRRTCHHYLVPIHHIHARVGRILAIFNELTVDIDCSDVGGELSWTDMMTWKSMMMSLITYWRRSSCLHHWTSCFTSHFSLLITVSFPSFFSEAIVEVVMSAPCLVLLPKEVIDDKKQKRTKIKTMFKWP